VSTRKFLKILAFPPNVRRAIDVLAITPFGLLEDRQWPIGHF
jgi:hypothetical protein